MGSPLLPRVAPLSTLKFSYFWVYSLKKSRDSHVSPIHLKKRGEKIRREKDRKVLDESSWSQGKYQSFLLSFLPFLKIPLYLTASSSGQCALLRVWLKLLFQLEGNVDRVYSNQSVKISSGLGSILFISRLTFEGLKETGILTLVITRARRWSKDMDRVHTLYAGARC